MREYLFIGGPWNGQWHPVPNGERSRRVPEFGPVEPIGYGLERIHLYTPRRAIVPGWLVPLTFYVHESFPWGAPIPRGTVLPGWVEGEQPVSVDLEWRPEP